VDEAVSLGEVDGDFVECFGDKESDDVRRGRGDGRLRLGFGNEKDAAGVGDALGEPRGVARGDVGHEAVAIGIHRGVHVADGLDHG
jgi:hypothetical protein